MLGHKISRKGIEVDKAKLETIEKLSPFISVKAIRSFLEYAGFYKRFINNFPKIAISLTKLFEKNVAFNFEKICIYAFNVLKEK